MRKKIFFIQTFDFFLSKLDMKEVMGSNNWLKNASFLKTL